MKRVLIAGGGIAGMAAALAARRAGWAATVIERAPSLGEVGAGLQLSPNACRVLDWLGVLDAVERVSSHPEAAVLCDGITGARIFNTSLGPTARARWGAPYLHVHRADLLRILAGAAVAEGTELRLGETAERAVLHGDAIAIHTAHGAVHEADLVIGADGVRSNLRAAVNPREAPRFAGQIAWRGLVEASRLPPGTIPPAATVWAGAGRHVVSYFIRGGALINLIAVIEAEGWTQEDWSTPGTPDELAAAFDGWHPSITGLLGAVETVFIWGLYDRPEQVRWTAPRLALIGDAAHPMLPFMAQGAAQALEDVAVLMRHLGSADLSGALDAYETERWPRVTRVLQRAKANGRLFHHPPGLSRVLARTPIGLASRIAPDFAASRLDWLYGFDPVTGRGPER